MLLYVCLRVHGQFERYGLQILSFFAIGIFRSQSKTKKGNSRVLGSSFFGFFSLTLISQNEKN